MISKIIKNITKFNAKRTALRYPQLHKEVVNIYRNDQNNVGDYHCAPHLYFPELKAQALDLYGFHRGHKQETEQWIDAICNNTLILGGGGILNRSSFNAQMQLMEKLSQAGKKVVVWGAGHNDKRARGIAAVRSYNVKPDKFALFGVRDYGRAEEWIPCVSCMHSIFDKNFTTTQSIGLVLHKNSMKRPELLHKITKFPCINNTQGLDSVINFIASCETIVADSYHAMYWAILLGKKVIVVPNSSKFFDFKYKPVFSTFDTFTKDLNRAQSYSGVLDECRQLNIQFCKRVVSYLEC